jgi:hypothetical protein
VARFYFRVAEAVGKPEPTYFVEKSLLDPVTLDIAREFFPRAKEVVLVRDFRDRLSSVLAWNSKRAESGFGRDQYATDVEFVTARIRTEAESLRRHWEEQQGRAHLVRYEDLVVNPHETLRRLLEYLGKETDEDLVGDLLANAQAQPELLDAHRTVGDATESIGRWKRDLDPELLKVATEVLEPALAAFGYLDDPVAVPN